MEASSKKFFWGASTSSYQIEGGITNQWSEWEKQNSETLALNAEDEFGQLLNWPELKFQAQDPQNYVNGSSIDHWHRWREDFAFLEQIGLNSYRLSIEWSRLEPQLGVYDESAWQQYREMLQWLKDHNIAPFLTLWHWGFPLWAYERGGWLNIEVQKRFFALVEKTVTEFAGLVNYYLILNEPELYTGFSYLTGAWPPQIKSQRTTFRMMTELIKVHNQAYEVIKRIQPESKVSSANNIAWYEAGDRNIVTTLYCQYCNWIQLYFIRRTKQDFIGLNHYFHNRLFGRNIYNENKVTSDLGWEVMTDSLVMTLRLLAQFKFPIIITENGLADAKDILRAKYIEHSISQINQALSEGIEVQGYLHWSLLDNFEWDKGFWPRFGLVAVDLKTKQRSLRNSALKYKQLIQNSITS